MEEEQHIEQDTKNEPKKAQNQLNFSFLSARKHLRKQQRILREQNALNQSIIEAHSVGGETGWDNFRCVESQAAGILISCGSDGSVIWGGSFFISKDALRNVSEADSSFRRYLLSEECPGAMIEEILTSDEPGETDGEE